MNIKKLVTSLILLITVVLALVAGITSYKLFQIGKQPVSSSAPQAQKSTEKTPEIFISQPSGLPCQLIFTVPAPSCGSSCANNNNCPSGLSCQSLGFCNNAGKSACTTNNDCPANITCQLQSICVNPTCPRDNDCVCPSSSPSSSPPSNASPSPSPSFNPASPLPSPSVRTIAGASPLPEKPKGGITSASSLPKQQKGPAEELPSAGITAPTILLILGGISLIALGLLL